MVSYRGVTYHKSRHAAQPDLGIAEQVPLIPGVQCRETVAEQVVQWPKQRIDYTSVGRVRRQERRDRRKAYDQADNEHRQHRVPQPAFLRRVAIAVLPLLLAQPTEEVLHHAQRTDHAAVQPAEDKRKDDQTGQHGEIHSQHSRQELDLRHPAKPKVQMPACAEQQQIDCYEADDGKNDSDLA